MYDPEVLIFGHVIVLHMIIYITSHWRRSQLASSSRILDLRRQYRQSCPVFTRLGPSHSLAAALQVAACTTWHDLRHFSRLYLQPPHRGRLVSSYPEKINLCWWPNLHLFLARCLLRTASAAGADSPESLHYLHDNTTSTSPQWIRKSLCSWLLFFL